jgi:predicted DNA-binding transcriptional regulator YafY
VRKEKSAALLELARHLAASAEGLTLDEMGAAIGVGRRTAERMRDALYGVFPQMEEVSDPPTKRFRIPPGLDGFFQAPTAEELLELSKAASGLQMGGAASRAACLESLERKVRAAMRGAALRRLVPDVEALVRAETLAMQAGPRPFEEEAVIGKVRYALMAMKCLSFAYQGGRTPGAVRRVTPYGLMFGRMNYLVAAEKGSAEPRNWRLDRMGDLTVLDESGSPPATFSLQEYASRSFGIYQGEIERVVLRVSREGAADALRWRFHHDQAVSQEPDGTVIVRFMASGMLELAWHLFTWGDKIEVLAPESLRQTLVSQLQLALSRHNCASEPVAAGV